MGQFLDAMNEKWKGNDQYAAIRPDVAKIDALEASLQAVMEKVYFHLQHEYQRTTYGAFLDTQVQLDKDGVEKRNRIRDNVKSKVKIYWQTMAESLQKVDASNPDAVVQGEPIRSILRAFIPGDLDDMSKRKMIFALAALYSGNSENAAAAIEREVQSIAWDSIRKAYLMLVLETGVGGEIASAKGLASKGSARAGSCNEAAMRLQIEFKNLPEVDRLFSVSEGMAVILAALTSIKQLLNENDIEILIELAPKVSENVNSVVNGNMSDVTGQVEDGLHNMLKKLYKIELLECMLVLDKRRKTLPNADLRKELVESLYQTITLNADRVNLGEMIKLRAVAFSVAKDCENEHLTIQEILDRNSLKNKAAIAAKALSTFKYYVREAFPSLNTNLSIGIPNTSRKPITIAQAINDIDRSLDMNREQILKHYTCLKQSGQPLASTFGFFITVLESKKNGFSHVIKAVSGDKAIALSSLSIAAVIEHSLGFGVPKDDKVYDVWKAIENDLNLKNDPIVIALIALRDMIKLTMQLQGNARALVMYLDAQSKCKADVSDAIAFEFGRYYAEMVVQYPNLFMRLDRQVYSNLNELESIKTQTHIAQPVSSNDLVYQPRSELKRNLEELQSMNSGKTLSPEKILAMKLASALHDFAVDESDAFQSFASQILIELKTCTELKPVAERVQTKVDQLENSDLAVNFFAGVKSMVGFTRSQAEITPKDKLINAITAINNTIKPANK